MLGHEKQLKLAACGGRFDLKEHTHNRFTALLESVREYPGEQVPER